VQRKLLCAKVTWALGSGKYQLKYHANNEESTPPSKKKKKQYTEKQSNTPGLFSSHPSNTLPYLSQRKQDYRNKQLI